MKQILSGALTIIFFFFSGGGGGEVGGGIFVDIVLNLKKVGLAFSTF